MKKTIITFLLALVFPITASAQLESVKEYRRHKKCGGYKKPKMKCLQMTFEIINVVQHAFLIKKRNDEIFSCHYLRNVTAGCLFQQ